MARPTRYRTGNGEASTDGVVEVPATTEATKATKATTNNGNLIFLSLCPTRPGGVALPLMDLASQHLSSTSMSRLGGIFCRQFTRYYNPHVLWVSTDMPTQTMGSNWLTNGGKNFH